EYRPDLEMVAASPKVRTVPGHQFAAAPQSPGPGFFRLIAVMPSPHFRCKWFPIGTPEWDSLITSGRTKTRRTNPSLAAPKFSGNRQFGQPFRYRRANRPRQLANSRWTLIIFAQTHNDCAHRPANPLHAGSRTLLVRGHG